MLELDKIILVYVLRYIFNLSASFSSAMMLIKSFLKSYISTKSYWKKNISLATKYFITRINICKPSNI